MADYTHEYSAFPNAFYTANHFLDLKDAPPNVVALVTNIKNLIVNGSYGQANSILANNATTLKKYIIDAEYINRLDEELRNLEIYAKSKKQGIYYQSIKPDCVPGDVWIS